VAVSWYLNSQPATEPISVTDAMNHARIDSGVDETLVGYWITAARELAEDYTQQCFVPRSVTAIYDRFPPFDPTGWDYWLTPGYPSPAAVYPNPLTRALRLPLWPVVSLDSLQYYDNEGNLDTLVENQDYLTQLQHKPALAYPYPGLIWPVTQFARMGCVIASFTAGYSGANPPGPIPARLMQAMFLTLTYWNENRGDDDDPNGDDPVSLGLPKGALRLLTMMMRVGYC
jgi:hypothetical protein